VIIDRDAFYGRIIVYDGPYTAHCIARDLGVRAKHSAMRGSPHHTFSVVLTPTDRSHLTPTR
jgi:hypothetical protein